MLEPSNCSTHLIIQRKVNKGQSIVKLYKYMLSSFNPLFLTLLSNSHSDYSDL